MTIKLYKILILLVFIVSWIGCIPYNKYKVLSFFFDGVPDPNKIHKSSTDSLSLTVIKNQKEYSSLYKNVRRVQFNIHPVYREKACNKCHDRNKKSKLLQAQPTLCYSCHDNLKTKYSILHGPVQAGFCTSCHSPHLSKNKKLLIVKEDELCIYCHTFTDIIRNEAHEDIQKTDCLQCHNPHGGDDTYLLN